MTLTLGSTALKKAPPKLVVHTVTLTPQSQRVKTETVKVPEKPALIDPVVKQEIQTPPAPPQPKLEPQEIAKEPAKETQKETPRETPKKITKPTPKVTTPSKPKPIAKTTPPPKPVKKPAPKTKSTPQPAKKPVQNTAKQEKVKADEKARSEAKAKADAQAKRQKELQKKREEQQNALVAASCAEALASLDAADTLDKKKSTLSKSSSGYSSSSPQAISQLASESLVQIEGQDSDLSPQERTYYTELVSRLKLSLKLPEYGEVKVQLTLARSGSVVRLTGIKSKSKKNASYIEKTVPKLKLPPFGQNFSGEKEHTFKLTMSNELNY
jgi:hypothetical protein